jgi:hypothetical protein
MGFGWYMNQYDYTTETYTADSQDDGVSIINEGGDVTNNGESEESD